MVVSATVGYHDAAAVGGTELTLCTLTPLNGKGGDGFPGLTTSDWHDGKSAN